eukprot:bmy_20348T0
MRTLKGDAGSPAPGAGLERQVPGHALPGHRHLAPPHPRAGCLLRGPRGSSRPGSVLVPPRTAARWLQVGSPGTGTTQVTCSASR